MRYVCVPSSTVLLEDLLNEYCLFVFQGDTREIKVTWRKSRIRMRVVVLCHWLAGLRLGMEKLCHWLAGLRLGLEKLYHGLANLCDDLLTNIISGVVVLCRSAHT